MPSFQIGARRVLRQTTEAHACAIGEATPERDGEEGTAVRHASSCVSTWPIGRERAAALGVAFVTRPSGMRTKFFAGACCTASMPSSARRTASSPARVEPHGFHRSREGYRLRCYLPAREDELDVVSDFQVAGWHLYLLEGIEAIEAMETPFEPRAYRRTDDDVSMTISFRSEGVADDGQISGH